MKPEKRAVAVAARRSDGEGVLLVQRPEDDDELPGIWGLPAASLREGESLEAAAGRVGPEKLGVRLRVRRAVGEGTQDRGSYRLRMTVFEAVMEEGEPSVPQAVPGVTQYRDWRWGPPRGLIPGAREGSLCCRLFLEAEGIEP